jgi:twitching motility protein PilT
MAVIDDFFIEMKKRDASDLHMAIGNQPLLRLRGELIPLDFPVLTPESNRKILFEILSKEQQAIVKEQRDFDVAYALENVGRFRCNYFYHNRGIGGVFRIIPTEVKTLEELKLPEVLKTIASYRRGLVLITGPTGSGKSTTMAAMINHINENWDKHIITIEDPLEFLHSNKKSIFTQREVGTHAKSFSDALNVASREDPDIIMVGEMRDLETISLALSCAELGILVFGTVHTNSAAKTIDRIINTFPPLQQSQIRSMLSESLKAIIAQQLVNTKDGKGRCAAIEILIGSSALSSIIRDDKLSQIHSLVQTGSSVGMQSMDGHLKKLIAEHRITPEAAYEKAIDKSLFEAGKTE